MRQQVLQAVIEFEQHARGLSQHFGAAVAGEALESVIDENDQRLWTVVGTQFGNDDNVVEPGHAGLQQQELFLRAASFGDVAQIHRQPFGKRVGVQLQPLAQRGEKIF